MNTFKSVAANFAMDKAIEALDAYGIKLYETQENGTKILRQGANIFMELQDLFQKLDDEGRQKLALSISGGKYQVNAMMAFLSDANQNFRKIMDDIAKNSSDELTTKLLRLGLDTWDVKLMQLKASFETLGKSIGDSVLPELKSMTAGLTNSIYWLTEHKQQVNEAVNALIELGKILLAYVIQQKTFALQQRVTNALVAEGTILLRAMYMLEGDWKTAFAGMTGSLKTFGATVATMTLQLGAFYVAMNVVAALYSRLSDKSGLTGQQQDLINQLQSLETGRAYALANTSRTGVSADEVNRSFDEQKATLQAKLDAVNSAMKEKESQIFNKAQAESERAFQAMIDKAIAQQERIASVANQLPDKTKGGKGAPYAPDSETRLAKLDVKHDVASMFANSAIEADKYSASLTALNNKIEMFGLTSQNSTERIALMQKRVGQLLAEAIQYTQTANEYEDEANKIISGSAGIKEALDKEKLSWSTMTKEQKQSFSERYRSYVSDYDFLMKLLDEADKLRKKAAESQKDASNVGVNSVRVSLDDAITLYQKSLRELGYDESHEIFGLGRFPSEEAKRQIELKYAIEQLNKAKEELARIERETPDNTEKIKAQQKEVDDLSRKVETLNDKWYSVRDGLAGVTSEVLTQGATLRQIWSNLWRELQNEAIRRLFNVQAQASLLGSIFGLFGGKIGGNMPGMNTKPLEAPLFHSGGIVVPRFHSGTIVTPYLKNLSSDEVPAILQTGEEVNSRAERRSNELLADVAKTAMLQNQNQQPVTIVINALDARSFNDYLRSGGGEIILNYLRGQKQLNNNL